MSRYFTFRGERRKDAPIGFHLCVFSSLKMVRLHHFHISCKEYYNRGKNNLFPELYGCPNPCCSFKGRLRRHGFYTRFALTLTATYLIFIQRYYCPSCKRTVSLLPSFLAPNFQYTLACIFFSFYQIAVRRLTLEHIASKINLCSGRTEMSYQHICFYRRRLLENRPLIIGFLGSKEMVMTEPDPVPWLITFVSAVHRHFGLEAFCLEYFTFQTRHFMSKS